ncbi:MAG: response regulator [Synechococcaceae cyanobacterium RL_1_2]|nr:response regulator [Synechococcaceae cyanobacterium RL_1_2]
MRSANDGMEAIDIWEEWHPDLIWMDMKMPVMNGYESVKIIREKETMTSREKVIIIALTATAFSEEKEDILASGCNDFVRKPCKEEIIFNKISQYLNVRYLYESLEIQDQNKLNNPNQFSLNEIEQLKESVKLMPSQWIKQMS